MPGDALGLIRIPRLGSNYSYAIVEGVSTDDLKKGPGHYPGTAMPGGGGNFVLSGHRTTYLAPFNGIGELSAGEYAKEMAFAREKVTASDAPHWKAFVAAWSVA